MAPECARPATVGTNDDGTWFAVCGCGTTVSESGTYEDVVTALIEHRATT